MTELRQTSHSRLLALEVTGNESSITSSIFEIFKKLQVEGIHLTNELIAIYFEWNWKELAIKHVGVEVKSIMQVEAPFQLLDFKPEFCYGKSIKLDTMTMEISELLQIVSQFNSELATDNLKTGNKGKISFKWGGWNDELSLELFSFTSTE